MAVYEILTITSSSSNALSLVEKTIQKQGGKVQDKNDWGEKNFVYPIKKEPSGFYTLWEIEIAPEKIEDLRHELKMNEEILRAMIIQKDTR